MPPGDGKVLAEGMNQGEFPYYVQIAPYDYGRKNADKTEAAEIRQVQLECLKEIPNAGMVVTADIEIAPAYTPLIRRV